MPLVRANRELRYYRWIHYTSDRASDVILDVSFLESLYEQLMQLPICRYVPFERRKLEFLAV